MVQQPQPHDRRIIVGALSSYVTKRRFQLPTTHRFVGYIALLPTGPLIHVTAEQV